MLSPAEPGAGELIDIVARGALPLNIAEHFDDAPHVGMPDRARRFAEPFGNQITEWWRECPCGSWLLWVAGIQGLDPLVLVAAACECARQSLDYLPPGETRPEAVIAVAERWIRSEVTNEECRDAGNRIPTIQQEIGDRLQDKSLLPTEGIKPAAARAAAQIPQGRDSAAQSPPGRSCSPTRRWRGDPANRF